MKKFLLLIFVFLFILADVLCDNFLSIVYHEQHRSMELGLFSLLIVLHIISAPIQSGISDINGRKNSLIFSLFSLTLSLIFIYMFNNGIRWVAFLFLGASFKGILGNSLPISLAVIADKKDRNYRAFFCTSTSAYAVAYLALAIIISTIDSVFLNTQINGYLILLFSSITIFCIIFFNHPEDKNLQMISLKKFSSIPQAIKHQVPLIWNSLKNSHDRKALTAFFLWEISLYSILISQVDFQMNKISHIADTMMVGYLIGVIILLTCCYRIRDKQVIKIGYYVSFLSLIPYFILFKIVNDKNLLIRSCYFFHALGNAFLSPAFLSMIAKERKSRDQGRIYGLADSADTIMVPKI